LKFVYGPVPSRRLGQSLGIDLLPFKTCNYQCIYCQLGRTTHFTNFRRDFFSKKDIIGEMESAIILNEERTDYITFVGSGEPTLYKSLKALINFAKNISNKPVCVITNGSLLYNQEVQEALLLADVVLPSFDAGDKKNFIKINRPHPSLDFNDILQGFINFRNRYVGKFWIEIMIMKGINDDHTNLQKIKKEIDLINPDRIDVNVPIRPPTESWVKIPDMEVINIIEEIFGDYYDMNYSEYGEFNLYSTNFKKELLALIKRHPMRQNQIIETFSTPCFKEEDIIKNLKSLESQYKIKNIIYNDNIFWQLYV
jgi:wyosine [tRNA(Phe)-imidazoG37] synthetase (radical SAM superfamily)